VDFLFIDFKLFDKLILINVFRKAFDKNGEIGGGTAFLINLDFLNFLIKLEDGKSNKPDDDHPNTYPALNIVVSIIFRSRIELFRPKRNSQVVKLSTTSGNSPTSGIFARSNDVGRKGKYGVNQQHLNQDDRKVLNGLEIQEGRKP
jgi:hypothetical protein